MKIVINAAKHGGFSISKAAMEFMADKGSEKAQQEFNEYLSTPANERISFSGEDFFCSQWDRDDLFLIEAVETLGDKASGMYARLAIVEIPDGVEWEVKEYDGSEWIAEKHRTWHAGE